MTEPEITGFDPLIALVGAFIGIALLAVAVVSLRDRKQTVQASRRIDRQWVVIFIVLLVIGVAFHFGNDALTDALLNMSTTGRFFLAMGVAVLLGVVRGFG